MRLYEATKKRRVPAARRRSRDFILRELADDARAGWVLREQRGPGRGRSLRGAEEAVRGQRRRRSAFFARLAQRDGGRATYRPRSRATLRASRRPDAIKGRGRMLGDFLLALEETRGVALASLSAFDSPAS